MSAAYSFDLRERVVGTVEEGASRRRAAGLFKVSVSTAIRWARRMAETGSCAARPSGGDHRSKAVEALADWLLALNRTEPDLTLAEIQTRLRKTHGLTKSVSSLWRFFARHGISFKKRPRTPPNRTVRMSGPRARRGARVSDRWIRTG